MDRNGDKVITEADSFGLKGVDMQNFTANMDAMVDALTNINNPAFDLKTSRDLLADYYIGGTRENADGTIQNIMGVDEQVYNKNYQNEIKKKQSGYGRGGDDQTVYRVNNRDIRAHNFHKNYDHIIDWLQNPTEKQMQLPTGLLAKYENGKWYGRVTKEAIGDLAQ